jgi:hypothetical protein
LVIAETKAMALLIKSLPIVGGTIVFIAYQIEQQDGNMALFIWRTVITVLFTLSATLIGILYRDLRSWIRRVEDASAAYQSKNRELIMSLAAKHERMIGVLTMIPMVSGSATIEEKIRLIQEVRTVLES